MRLANLVAKRKIKGIIFDLDGTLTNTLEQHIDAFSIVFKNHGYNIPREKIQNQMGRRPTDITRTLIFKDKLDNELSQEEKATLQQIALEKETLFRSLIPVHPPMMPGLPDILIQAKELGLNLVVVSSTTLEGVSLILERLDLLKYFDALDG